MTLFNDSYDNYQGFLFSEIGGNVSIWNTMYFFYDAQNHIFISII